MIQQITPSVLRTAPPTRGADSLILWSLPDSKQAPTHRTACILTFPLAGEGDFGPYIVPDASRTSPPPGSGHRPMLGGLMPEKSCRL